MLDESGLQLKDGSDLHSCDFNVRLLANANWAHREISQALELSVGAVGRMLRRPSVAAEAATGQKSCARCQSTFPATNEYFGKDRHQGSGLTTACKECLNAASRERRLLYRKRRAA
jgi:hypothetical protein